MELNTGFYSCQNDIWGNSFYDANHILTVNRYPEDDIAQAAYNNVFDDDFIKITKTVTFEYHDEWMKKYLIDQTGAAFEHQYTQTVSRYALSDEVVAWLNENVAPSTDRNRKDTPEGWSMRRVCAEKEDMDLSIFFLRRQDALNFVRKFSKYDKFTRTYNQHTYVEKVLNIKNNRYEVVKRN